MFGALLLSSPAFAADVTYAGITGIDHWNAGTSWYGGVVPGKDDRAIIGTSPTRIVVPSPSTAVQDIGSIWIKSASPLTHFTNESMQTMRFYGTGGIAALNESANDFQFFRRTTLANDLIFRADNAAGGGFTWSGFPAPPFQGIDLAGHTATFDTVNAANTMSFTGIFNIQGAGNIIKTGAGTLTIGSVSQYTGSTTIDAGTLALTGNGSIASSSGLHNDGVFDITATNTGASIKSLSGNGLVDIGTKTLTLTQAHDTLHRHLLGQRRADHGGRQRDADR